MNCTLPIYSRLNDLIISWVNFTAGVKIIHSTWNEIRIQGRIQDFFFWGGGKKDYVGTHTHERKAPYSWEEPWKLLGVLMLSRAIGGLCFKPSYKRGGGGKKNSQSNFRGVHLLRPPLNPPLVFYNSNGKLFS